ncbi:copper amine oxidase [Daldinia sp. FL1419]|nr:copper amine oxidase [Daldinia sp. FL1419]
MGSTISDAVPHPLDPLSPDEIQSAISIVKKAHGDVFFNVVSLHEPRKAEMVKWLANPVETPRPPRVVDIVVIAPGGKVYDGFVDIASGKITKWELLDGLQPIITMEELVLVEHICRKDPKVIEQCEISGIPKEDMHKVYCDPWTIGYDERHGNKIRLQQALMYYRPNVDDCQYQYPLDFCPIYDAENQKIIAIDIPKIRRPLSKVAPINYHPAAIEKAGGYRSDLKPINITQPEGVSFKMKGRELEWQNWNFHIGFNYREGIILNNITYNDKGTIRPIFYRLSLAEMVVPYGNPEHPHQRKHAFDLGEYGAGYMTNSLTLGCDCKGSIHYLDAHFPSRSGDLRTIKNAICIHEEDDGILFKHTDFRDESVIVTRARKLIIQQIFTAANYEYAIQWIFHQDGTIQPEIKLTGILNTYAMNPDEDTNGWGTQVYPGKLLEITGLLISNLESCVNAHNHQHLFCLRIDANVDGPNNTVFMADAVPSEAPVGSPENYYGNAFYAKRTKLDTTGKAATDYDGATSRTWDICNMSKLHPYSKRPASYKLVSREVPRLLPKEGSLVWKRAGFARHAVHVTKYRDDQLWPAGRHVPQTSGEPSLGLPEWIGDGTEPIEDTNVVLWHTFGVVHIPAPEDFPVMPVEPITLLLRPRNFFTNNPVMDVPPSYASTPSQVASNGAGVTNTVDKMSKLAFANGGDACCGTNGTNGVNGH